MIVGFLGHRSIYDSNLYSALYRVVEEKILQGCMVFYVGTHGDFDKLALSICRKLRKIYQDITINVVITSLNTIKPIIVKDKIFGDDIIVPYSDVNTIMFEIENLYYKYRIVASNKKMIDICDTLICFVNENKCNSASKFFLKYARKKGLEIINLFQDNNE